MTVTYGCIFFARFEVSSMITNMAQAAGETRLATGKMHETTSDLSKQVQVLRDEVEKFLDHIYPYRRRQN
jgi:hypothetical protein